MREINIRESIKKRKLVAKESLICNLSPLFAISGFLGFILSLLLSEVIAIRMFDCAASKLILLIFILFAISVFMIKNSINAFTFQVFKGKSIDDNIKIAERVLQENRKLKVIRSNKQFIQAYLDRPLSSLDWSNELYIIFDNEDVLINFCSLARFDIPHPFQFYSDRQFERELINKFHSVETSGISVMAEPNFSVIKIVGLLAWASIIIAIVWLFIK